MPGMYQFSSLTEYAKYLRYQCSSCGNHGLKDCDMCPPGLSAVFDGAGKHMGCVTPKDAYIINQRLCTCSTTCNDGYVKAYAPTGAYLGCLTPQDYVAALQNYQTLQVSSYDFEPQTAYPRFTKAIQPGHNHYDHGCCNTCGHHVHDKRSCCPSGTIAIFDNCGKNQGCVSASDAYLALEAQCSCSVVCNEGMVRTTAPDGTFMGCLTLEDSTYLMTQLDTLFPPTP